MRMVLPAGQSCAWACIEASASTAAQARSSWFIGSPWLNFRLASAHQARSLRIEGPVRHQVLHRERVVARAEAVLPVELMRLLDLGHVQLDPQARRLRHLD